MTAWKQKLLPLTVGLVALILDSTLSAAGKEDLDRTEPVAEMEKIPVMDFFRPAILQEPSLNPSGTYIAAVIAARDDHTSLMVYNLDTKTMETVGSRGDSDTRVPASAIWQIKWPSIPGSKHFSRKIWAAIDPSRPEKPRLKTTPRSRGC